ncbi:hypothetical protein LMG19146_01517 [Xanthomonas arboricola pv. fragariae]|uniref:hypothetical protein n=1 Tax=Xanthomonas arboricola TaxID=56448 RepID=UPI000C81ECB9|nr:hypothetical protein [Xanthomonas arboricola]SOT98550.1 hypothetical protein LMG19146_01517 [Xanthomonas arboricola pv. fragariae]
MRADSSIARPQLSDLLLLVPVSIFGVGIPLGLIDVVYRLFDPMYGGPLPQRLLRAGAEIGLGLMAFFGLVSAWIVVVSSDAALRAHRRRTLIVALGLLVGTGVALHLLADWLSGRIKLDVFALVFSGLLAVAPMLVAARHLPRILRATPPAAMLRGCRHGQ